MKFPGLLAALAEESALGHTLDDVRLPGVTTLDVTAVSSFFPVITAAIAGQDRMVLAVTSTYREAEQLTSELGTWLGEEHVEYFPA